MDEHRYGVEMTEKEIAEFLTSQGHGVLSFDGDQPYGLPLSFGYDVLENRCLFQLFSQPESRKQEALAESNTVNLVAYEWSEVDDWRSVLIDGRLVPINADDPAAVDAAEVFAEQGSVVGIEVFDRPIGELTPRWYELRIEAMSGYKSPLLE